MAAQHCDEFGHILKRVDADEQGVVARLYVPDGAGFYGVSPFQVPPELGLGTVTPCCGEAGVSAHNLQGYTWDEVCDWA